MNGLRKTTGGALILTFLLIVLGAWVRATNSGLSCPDWPTCYGHWVPLPGDIPDGAGYTYFQVMLEWVHRLVAGVFLGPLIIVIGFLCWRARSYRPRLPLFGLTLIVLLLIQASLGGLTVFDRNSPWSVALHLSTALILFSMLWLIFERSASTVNSVAEHSVGKVNKSLALSSVAVWVLAIATMASAAMTAKSGASLACSTWPLCDGAVIPDLGDPLIRLHTAHRWLAATTALGVFLLFLTGRHVPGLGRLIHGALILILCQIALGATVIVLEVPVWTAVAHQALGVLTFALITRIMWRAVAGTDDGGGETAVLENAPSRQRITQTA